MKHLKIPIIALIAAIAVGAAVFAVRFHTLRVLPDAAPESAADNTLLTAEEAAALLRQAETEGAELLPGVYVVSLGGYTGAFPEDGSGDAVKNAAAAYIVNLSDVSYKYLEFSLRSGGNSYVFFASTLLSGAKMTVVEQSKAIYEAGDGITAELMNAEAFDGTPSVALDVFRIRYGNGELKAENISGAEKKNVSVYYKQIDENGYLGGITYVVKLGSVGAGAYKSSEAANLYKNKAKVVFVTYED